MQEILQLWLTLCFVTDVLSVGSKLLLYTLYTYMAYRPNSALYVHVFSPILNGCIEYGKVWLDKDVLVCVQ